MNAIPASLRGAIGDEVPINRDFAEFTLSIATGSAHAKLNYGMLRFPFASLRAKAQHDSLGEGVAMTEYDEGD